MCGYEDGSSERAYVNKADSQSVGLKRRSVVAALLDVVNKVATHKQAERRDDVKSTCAKLHQKPAVQPRLEMDERGSDPDVKSSIEKLRQPSCI